MSNDVVYQVCSNEQGIQGRKQGVMILKLPTRNKDREAIREKGETRTGLLKQHYGERTVAIMN